MPTTMQTQMKPKTLADVESLIKADPSITQEKRNRYLSAISRTARCLRRPASDIPCAPGDLRPALKAIHPERAKLSKKSLANIKGDLAAALHIAGVLERFDLAEAASEEWTTFLKGGTVDHQRWHLSRFAKFCTARGIPPMAVGDDTLVEFCNLFSRSQIVGDPDQLRKDTARNFNRIMRDNQINRPELSVPRRGGYRAAALDAYPPTLQQDVDRYLHRLSNPNPFRKEDRDKPLAPTSLRNIRLQVTQALDAAVQAGYPREHFQSLGDLVDREVIEAAFWVISDRIGSDAPPSIYNIAATLLAIGRHHLNSSDETLEMLAAIKRRVAEITELGQPTMTEKNSQRLRQFDDPEAVEAIVLLPEELMRRADREAGSPRAALIAMRAVAIAVLLECPMRARNLAGLDLAKHLQLKLEGRRPRYTLFIPKAEVKNRMAIEADLSPSTSQLLKRYIDKHRPQLLDAASDALFPRRDGRARDPGKLGEESQAQIYKETGLEVHIHLIRHLAAKLILDKHPGEYETVRHALGHKRSKTTLGYYTGLQSRAALRRFGEVLEHTRGKKGRKK